MIQLNGWVGRASEPWGRLHGARFVLLPPEQLSLAGCCPPPLAVTPCLPTNPPWPHHIRAQVNAEDGHSAQGQRDVGDDEQQEGGDLGDVAGQGVGDGFLQVVKDQAAWQQGVGVRESGAWREHSFQSSTPGQRDHYGKCHSPPNGLEVPAFFLDCVILN